MRESPAATGENPGRSDYYMSIDLGTSHYSYAFTGNGVPTMGTMERVSGGTGRYDRSPTAFRSPLQLVGYDQLLDYSNIQFGLKQALDPELPGEIGKSFLEFLKREGKTTRECLQLIFTDVKTHSEDFRRSKNYGALKKLAITVPVRWSLSEAGRRIQDLIAETATDAGFPSDIIDIRTEPEAGVEFVKYLEREEQAAIQKEQQKAILKRRLRNDRTHHQSEIVHVLDVGAGLTHSAVYETHNNYWLLIHEDSADGGMEHAWPVLLRKCREMSPSNSFFKDAKAHVEKLGKSCQDDFEQDGKMITAAELCQIVDDCFKEPRELAKTVWLDTKTKMDKIVFMGTALVENEYIKSLWEDHLMKVMEEGGKCCPKTKFLDNPNAVCLGASLPLSDDPTEPVWKLGFGFYVDVQRGKGEEQVVLQVKPRRSHTCVAYWEEVMPPEESPGSLPLELCTFGASAKRRTDWSRSSNRYAYSKVGCVPMANIDVKLKIVEPEAPAKPALVRFIYEKSKPKLLTLEVRYVKGWKTVIDLELFFDGKIWQAQTTGEAREVRWEDVDKEEVSGNDVWEVPFTPPPSSLRRLGKRSRPPASPKLSRAKRRRMPTDRNGPPRRSGRDSGAKGRRQSTEVPDSEDDRRLRRTTSRKLKVGGNLRQEPHRRNSEFRGDKDDEEQSNSDNQSGVANTEMDGEVTPNEDAVERETSAAKDTGIGDSFGAQAAREDNGSPNTSESNGDLEPENEDRTEPPVRQRTISTEAGPDEAGQQLVREVEHHHLSPRRSQRGGNASSNTAPFTERNEVHERNYDMSSRRYSRRSLLTGRGPNSQIDHAKDAAQDESGGAGASVTNGLEESNGELGPGNRYHTAAANTQPRRRAGSAPIITALVPPTSSTPHSMSITSLLTK